MKKNIIGLFAVLAVAATLVVSGCGQPEVAQPTLQEVESTTFSHVGYDPASQELTMVFREGGETYVYKGISADVYQGLVSAESVGAYYHANIRDQFEYDRK